MYCSCCKHYSLWNGLVLVFSVLFGRIAVVLDAYTMDIYMMKTTQCTQHLYNATLLLRGNKCVSIDAIKRRPENSIQVVVGVLGKRPID